MPYRTTEKTRKKKDAKRTAMMTAAMRVFAEKGYHAATVRDVVSEADVAIGTFYFYFPDKETLFVHLYEETADFLLQALEQAIRQRENLAEQVNQAIQAYINLAIYEPAIVQLLLVGGVGAVPSLSARRQAFRNRLVQMWERPLNQAIQQKTIPDQNTRRAAEAIAGAHDEVVLQLLSQADPELEAALTVQELTLFTLRAVAYSNQAQAES